LGNGYGGNHVYLRKSHIWMGNSVIIIKNQAQCMAGFLYEDKNENQNKNIHDNILDFSMEKT
jgi:hypothetical protein